ncbi:ATP-dependent nuclease subunit b [Heliomicrobium modesticaldum Ice1]|uniref:ATP-dependent helicase/deoxyribonuclease subunit B n=1 Tax=Heliobacterium modesticaldum (strain ATCC 51547 / Ice1) TaxID=498761 RepID=ADDB_HELMI|nr:PD-(D/E)XK nuclease family protein [Heliomicrobium modesticaldum]B0TDI1.1 RecName: Full=ATP-dependent helicase/deoxyribonuclease subunit B; AltName: Full=ATP-dependent helicase/nuclease AddB; AltName: Full=DNA 3'-5' helicase AddB [Heliomicrobium modesticaldum Ice1]ABZ85506.1 ATP-dependent nuclease subunit b [Heliomicrobium modesticaldum Ice1]
MSLRFILGRAGTGKSRACLDEIAQELKGSPQGPPLLFLVPEQATFQTERALATMPGLGGTIRAQVFSFRRLAYRVLQEVGGSARIPIGDLGKRMILRNLLEKHKDELRLFHRSAGQPGFADALAGALSELKLYNIDATSLDRCQTEVIERQGAGLLADKLHDLALLYGALKTFLEGKYTDPDDYLHLLAQRIPGSVMLRDAEVWVDGFAGFTPQELSVLAALMSACRRVNVALCLDPTELDEPCDLDDPFFRTRETQAKLLQLAFDRGIVIEKALHLVPAPGQSAPRFQHPELQHLESFYFRRPAPPWLGGTQSLFVCAAANRRSEVEGAAREIIRLCRDQGYRWRDVAVLLRDLESYYDSIESVFSDFGIPLFIDSKRPAPHHPLVELIRSALEAVLRDWAYEPVFRYLKTDLVPLSRGETDRLENYVLAHGIRGRRWRDREPWLFRRRLTLGEDALSEFSDQELAELAEINGARDRARAALASFHKAVVGAKAVRPITAALYQLLVDLKAPEQISCWIAEAEAAGRIEEAHAHRQVWAAVIDLFDQIVESLGETPLDLATYAVVMEAGLDSLKLSLIPPELDQVFVGSLDRSRCPGIRAAFVLGVSEGVLPARPKDDGIFDDKERERIYALTGLELAPGSRRRLFDEEYHIYVALTRASERCYLSYPLADAEGRAQLPSSVIARVRELFPQVTERTWLLEPGSLPTGAGLSGSAFAGAATAETAAMAQTALAARTTKEAAMSAVERELAEEYIVHPARSLSYLIPSLREALARRPVPLVWWAVYSWLAERPAWRELLARVLSGLWHKNREQDLPKPVSRRLFGDPLRASVSRIERFLACPFSHFISHGLRLKERRIFRLAAPDLGEFFHAALKQFGERLRRDRLDWGALPREELFRLTGEVVSDLAPQLQNEILLSTARHRYLTGRLQQTLSRAVIVLGEHARRGQFRPLALEVGFGPEELLPPVQVPLTGGRWMDLVGRIDRIDGFFVGDASWLRVIDYKSNRANLKLADIAHGLKLQLLAYLDVALRHGNRLLQGCALGEDRPSSLSAATACHPGGMLYFGICDPLLSTGGPLTRDEAERAILKEAKMCGHVLADPAVVAAMDGQTRQGYSPLIPVGLKKEGGFYSASSVLTMEQFALLRQYLQSIVARVGEAILDGLVSIRPHRRDDRLACSFCPYKSVCQFDLLLQDNDYRLLIDDPPEKIWEKIAAGPKAIFEGVIR